MGDVIQRISVFLMPVVEAIAVGENVNKLWTAERGWQRIEEGG
jgi:hypothetical protein